MNESSTPQRVSAMAKVKSEEMRRSESLQVPVTRSMRREVEARARQRGWPIAEVGRQALDAYLKQKDPIVLEDEKGKS